MGYGVIICWVSYYRSLNLDASIFLLLMFSTAASRSLFLFLFFIFYFGRCLARGDYPAG